MKKCICEAGCYLVIILLVLLTFSLLYAIILMCILNRIDIGNFSEFVSACVATLALAIAMFEYVAYKDKVNGQVLSEYNKRYSQDPNIVKVVKYLNSIEDVENVRAFPSSHIPTKEAVPTNYEVEMFMRFFEEIQLQIEKGRLKYDDVDHLFLYYARKIDEDITLREKLGITEKEYALMIGGKGNDKCSWQLFHRLISKKMQ